MKILSIASAKGGVGKTTTAVHLAAALCQAGARCLLVDLDPQGSVAPSLGLAEFEPALSSTAQLNSPQPLRPVWLERIPGLGVIGANPDSDPLSARPPAGRLQQAARALQCDFVLLDLSPALEPLTLWGLGESDLALIVLQASAACLRTLPTLLKRILAASPNIAVEGLLLNHFGTSGPFGQELIQSLKGSYGDWVMPCEIPVDESLQKAASLGQLVFDGSPEAPAANAFRELALEILRRHPLEQVVTLPSSEAQDEMKPEEKLLARRAGMFQGLLQALRLRPKPKKAGWFSLKR